MSLYTLFFLHFEFFNPPGAKSIYESFSQFFQFWLKAETHDATNRCDESPRLHCCCDKAACAYFVAVICGTNSNQFEFVRQIAATKFCRSDNDFHMSHASQRFVASCVSALKASTRFNTENIKSQRIERTSYTQEYILNKYHTRKLIRVIAS